MGRNRKKPIRPPAPAIVRDGVEYITPHTLVRRWDDAISEPTLRNWRVQGYGPPYTKLGTRVVYPLAGLVEWEKTNTIQSP